MKSLEKVYRKNGYEFREFERIGDVAIYEQIDPETGNRTAYEVFKVKKQRAREAFGVQFEEKEIVPTNEEWGKLGYTVWTEGAARLKMAQLLKKTEDRNLAEL